MTAGSRALYISVSGYVINSLYFDYVFSLLFNGVVKPQLKQNPAARRKASKTIAFIPRQCQLNG
jgi:hypothetical protein